MSVRFTGRREDGRLLTGQGRYASDWNRPDQLYGHFLRADRAHAQIVSLDVEAARRMPGVAAVFTGADTTKAGFKSPPPLVKYPGKGGMALKVPHRDVLADGCVRFVGQEVALVVASTAAAAQDASERIEIEYRDLPVVVDAEAALGPGAPRLHADISGNLAFDYEYGDAAKTDAGFAQAAHVTRLSLDAARIVGNPMEPKACLATYDATSDSYDVYTCTQGMSIVRAGLSGITGVAEDKIRVHARDVGGGFGIRGDAYPEYCALMLAAKALGRPVKWVSSRSETIVSDFHGRAARLTGELALDRDGNFLAVRIQWIVNAGAYLSVPGPFINTMAPSLHAVNAYRIPAVYGLHRLALTNTTPTTAYRGAGRPNVTYLMERLVDEAARETGLDRVALRRRNLIPKEAFPYKTPTPAVYDSGDPPGLLAEALEHSGWTGFAARREAAERRGRLRGIGVAMFIEPSGGGGAPKEEVAIKFGASGNPVVYALCGPSGQGHETVFPEIVAEALGLAADDVTLHASDPDGPELVGEGTIGSRSIMSHGGAMVVAAREVIKKGLPLAAEHLEVAASDLKYEGGRYRVPGTDLSVGLSELARKHAQSGANPLDTLGEIPLPRSFPGGAHVTEVEVDPDTGVVEIVSFTAVDDCGRIINHALVEGQIHGGIAQGLGQAMGEHAVYDPDTGQLLTGTFMDYVMPRADGLPAFDTYDHPVPSPGNPLGAKGAGESGTTGAVPSVANAVIDALRPLGIHHLDFPFTGHRVWQAIRTARG